MEIDHRNIMQFLFLSVKVKTTSILISSFRKYLMGEERRFSKFSKELNSVKLYTSNKCFEVNTQERVWYESLHHKEQQKTLIVSSSSLLIRWS